ncbi:MAG: AMP-binding protein [Lachnospiraceae bacterium]|nr:AMP-binding protein [Lachnospiraceae bacterium]
MKECILLTGGTGFVGAELAAGLARKADKTVYVLVRAADDAQALHRLKAAWQHDPALYRAIGHQMLPLPGDFAKPGLGLHREMLQELQQNVTKLIHAGAEISFDKSKAELQKTNVDGTRNMIDLARSLPHLKHFVYLSTAYTAGQKKGLILEDDLPGSLFSSHYEESKAEAETLLRSSGLPFSICRPGMIIGNSRTGRVRTFNTIYYILKQVLLGKMRFFPIHKDTPLNLVPVDYVADAVLKIAESDSADGMTFHLTCPAEKAPTAGELCDAVIDWAAQNLSVKLPRPIFLPLPGLKTLGLAYNKKEDQKEKNSLNNLLILLPYFYAEQQFDRTHTDMLCGTAFPDWRDSLGAQLNFACRKNFMRQTGQTVFEQAMVRRESRRYPITYYNITSEGIQAVKGPEVNKQIQKIRNALWAWGIRKGDRVALTGINSVDYLALEQAIGLMGAVSVPIYYTTPAAEAETLLLKSGARWFFVGDRRMLGQLEKMQTDAQLVLFSVVKQEKLPAAMNWDKFLEKSGEEAPAQYPDPEDLATIRYTSGTTGEPKGVTFNFSQLAWMGEMLTNLVSWQDRHKPMRYLSFLPLSHVVEGILASYAPYYLLADVGYYYLNDFGALTEALPKVRPTIFFSVPRFYEKLWEQVIANPVGKMWLNAPHGLYKKMRAKLLKTVVMKKAGIDQCSQLIVGSAPVSETLLKNFRALGIEIHNAYGQTEAPLITINRLGDNVLPTIGTALPETEITAEADGELIVKGPQVTLGYYGLQTENIQNGVLRTGDLGVIDENGHITLFGRKKDFIITAYGKNISIPKIEQRIKDIPGVSEAVLVGENRPYCTALIWLEGACEDLAGQIEQMNADLSNPERIRKYTVIEKPLSIQAGELTPNLKVKRNNVAAHYAAEIEAMYG